MIPKTPYNVRLAFGMALEAAGLNNATKDLEQLLDDGYQELFSEYFPGDAAFQTFVARFGATRIEILAKLDWTFDQQILAADPGRDQSVKEYFEKTFRPALATA